MNAESAEALGEFALIDRITADLTPRPPVLLGVGDDAAVLRSSGEVVVSIDTMVEGIHFRLNWSSAEDVGRKLVAACVADAEAMGATPIAVVISLAIPQKTATEWVDGFAAGAKAECNLAGAQLVGGDLASAEQIVATATVLGDLAGRAAVTRAGARPGDLVAMCGRLGWAEAGLAVLTRGFRSPRAVVVAHRVPEVPYGQGRVAAQAGASSMIDISDGLLADLGHVAKASKVRIDLESAAFEIAEPQQAVAAAIGGGDPLVFQLTGGDDHALVATFATGAVPDGWVVLGKVVGGEPGVWLDGVEPDCESSGWRHFGAR